MTGGSINDNGINDDGHYWVRLNGISPYAPNMTFTTTGHPVIIHFQANMGTGDGIFNEATTLTFSWTGSTEDAIVSDPDNQLSVADGSLLSSGASFSHARLTNLTYTWSIQLPNGATSLSIGSSNAAAIEGYAFYLTTECPDTDMDGTPNYLDTNSDDDLCPDAIEGGGTLDETDLVEWTSVSPLSLPVDANGIPVSAGTGQTGGSSLDENLLDPNCDQLLPVELVFFTGVKKDEGSLLKWLTASEIENDYFVVQRSRNGLDFVEIGRVDGAGTSMEEHSYEFLDRDISLGTYYYRLMQVDFDGAANFSNVVVLEYQGKNQFEVFPNPTDDKLYVNFGASQSSTAKLKIINMLGQVLYESDEALERGVNLIELSLANVPAGTYQIILYTGNQIYSNSILITR